MGVVYKDMKKVVIIAFLAVFFIPQVASASWWNPLSWKIFDRTNTKTEILEKRIEEPEKNLKDIKTPIADVVPTKKVITQSVGTVGAVGTVTEKKTTNAEKPTSVSSVKNLSEQPMAVISPNGGEVFQKGRQYTIKWNSNGIKTVKITLFSESQSIPFTSMNLPATVAIPNTGSYVWTVPNTLPTGSDYTIWVNNGDIIGGVPPGQFDKSDKTFSITAN